MTVVLILMMLAVLGVLVLGIAVMMRGGELNARYGNKLMVLRVSLQGAVIALLGVMFMMKH